MVRTIPNKLCPFTTAWCGWTCRETRQVAASAFFQRPLYQLQVQRNRFPTLSITLSSRLFGHFALVFDSVY